MIPAVSEKGEQSYRFSERGWHIPEYMIPAVSEIEKRSFYTSERRVSYMRYAIYYTRGLIKYTRKTINIIINFYKKVNGR